MVCTNCKNQDHDKCPGGTRCDCQHREPLKRTLPTDPVKD